MYFVRNIIHFYDIITQLIIWFFYILSVSIMISIKFSKSFKFFFQFLDIYFYLFISLSSFLYVGYFVSYWSMLQKIFPWNNIVRISGCRLSVRLQLAVHAPRKLLFPRSPFRPMHFPPVATEKAMNAEFSWLSFLSSCLYKVSVFYFAFVLCEFNNN